MAPSDARKESRKQKSRRMVGTASRDSGERVREETVSKYGEHKDSVEQLRDSWAARSGTTGDLENSDGNDSSSAVERRNPVTNELYGLNHRLISYMDRVKQNETLLMRAEEERQFIRQQLEKHRDEHNQQIEMLRLELDEHVQQAVTAEEKQAHSERKIQKLQEERKALKAELKARRQREASLERALVSEKREIREAHSKIAQLRNDAVRDEELRSRMSAELTNLKVENAKLHERMKVASMELTMKESKVSEAEKKVEFTSEDVRKKLNEQRAQLEKLLSEKLDEIRRKHEAELLRLKKQHEIDKSNTLLTYVSAEDHAKLDTQMRRYARKLQEAESTIGDLGEKLRDAEERIANITIVHEKKLAKEHKRRERLIRKLAEQDANQDYIRKELEKYRKLIDGLDMNENFSLNTPLGVKRTRPSLDLTPAPNSVTKLPENAESRVIEANKVPARRVLTPLRKVSATTAERAKSGGDQDPAGLQRDCRMM